MIVTDGGGFDDDSDRWCAICFCVANFMKDHVNVVFLSTR